MTKLLAEQSGFEIPAGVNVVCFSKKKIQNSSWAHPASFSVRTEGSPSTVKRPKLGMNGAMPPICPHDVNRGNFNNTFTVVKNLTFLTIVNVIYI